jgi:signal transduction histidine kinase
VNRPRADEVRAVATAVRRIDDPDALRSLQELHHDLRQPLAAINGLAAAALAQPDIPDTAAACLSEIGEQATLLLSMCRVVLEQPPIQAPVPMHVVVYEAATGFRWSHDVSVCVDAEPVLAWADPVELRRALVNLVENAVRVSGDDDTVRIVVRADETTVWVEVADSGPGFASGESGTASLGLAIVERFARRHGGALDIVRIPTGGTAVRFSLPRAGAEPRRRGDADRNRAAG